MTREEALTTLRIIRMDATNTLTTLEREAVDYAIQALEAGEGAKGGAKA